MEDSRRTAMVTALSILAVVGAAAIIVFTTSDGSHASEHMASADGLPQPAGGFYIVSDAYGAGPSTGEAARRSDLIALATVSEKLSPFWTTPDGSRPNMSERELALRPSISIFTPYQLDVKLALKGEGPADGRIILERLGGQIDKDIVVYEHDMFSLTPGTDVVVFLRDCGEARAKRLGSPGARYRIIDRYPLDEDGELVYDDFTYAEMVEIIEREGTLEAKGGIVPC